jgi:hypothetical protein
VKREDGPDLVEVGPGGGDVEAALAAGGRDGGEVVLVEDGGGDEQVAEHGECRDRALGEREPSAQALEDSHRRRLEDEDEDEEEDEAERGL